MRHLLIASILIFSTYTAAAQVPTVTGSTLVRVFEGNNSWNATLSQIGAGGSRPDSSFIKFSGSYLYKRITDNLYRGGTTSFRTSDTTGVVTIKTQTGKTAQQITMDTSGNGTLFLSLKPPAFQDANFTNNQPFNIYGSRFQSVNVPYSTRPNYVWGMGWNLGTNGARLNTHEAAGGIHFETYFQTAALGGGGATGMTEFHLFTIDTSGTTNRFLSSAEPWDGRRWASILTLQTDKLNFSDRATSAVWSVDPQNNVFDFQDTTGLRFNEPRGFALSVKNGANSAFLNVMDFNGSDELEIARQNITAVRIAPSVMIGTSATPSEKLQVSGNIRFSGALMPNNAAGSSGQVLTSAGAGAPPTWTTATTGTVTGTGASGQVSYWNGTSSQTGSANFTYDGTGLSLLTNTNAATENLAVRNSNAGSSAATNIRLWNNSSNASNRGLVIQLPSSAYASPYTSSAVYWLYENANQIWATNSSARMLLNTTGLFLGAATSPSERLHVSGNIYATGNISAGVQPATARIHAVGTENMTIIAQSSSTTGTSFEVKNTSSGGGDYTFSVAGSANAFAAGSFLGYDVVAAKTRYWINPGGDFGVTDNTTLSARLHVEGAGATSGTNTAVFENSAGTDILTIRDDQMSAFGTTPVSTEKLLVRGATSDNTTKAFVAERSSGTDVLGVQNDGKVSVNNAAYTEALTVNGNTQTDMLILTNQTASTATGKVVYDNGSGGTFSGTMSLGDGTHALVMAPTLIERHVLDYLVNWSTGRKGAFWTVPARFDGYKIAKAYISVTAIGAGAGDDELTIEIGGVGEGVQVITAGTHTLVMNDVINTDDVITFNITEISATPAQGLHVSFELSKL